MPKIFIKKSNHFFGIDSVMKIEHKDPSYFHRLENAVRYLATSTESPPLKVERAITSHLISIIPEQPVDSTDEKLWRVLKLATERPEVIRGEGRIAATLRHVRFSTLCKMMNLIFDAYLEIRPKYERKK
jgi:hypothetical protein